MLNVLGDNERMKRTRPAFRYEVLQRTTHFRIIDGRTYQDCVARRLSDNSLRVIGLPA